MYWWVADDNSNAWRCDIGRGSPGGITRRASCLDVGWHCVISTDTLLVEPWNLPQGCACVFLELKARMQLWRTDVTSVGAIIAMWGRQTRAIVKSQPGSVTIRWWQTEHASIQSTVFNCHCYNSFPADLRFETQFSLFKAETGNNTVWSLENHCTLTVYFVFAPYK